MGERRWRPSARLRILGWILGLTAFAVVGSFLLTLRLLLQQLDAEVNDHLSQEVEEIGQLSAGRDPTTGQPFGENVEAIFDTFLQRNIPFEGEAYYTFVDGGFFRGSAGPADLWDDAGTAGLWQDLDEPARGELDSDAGRVRWLAVPLVDDSGGTLGVFVVANFLDEARGDVREAITTGFAVAGVILLVAGLVGWVAAGRILRPVRNVTETARAITETDLSGRIEVEGDDEIAELGHTFNAMLGRLEAALATQQAFVDDAGHELRTPITIVRGHLEVMGDDPDERRETLALVTDELDRMSRIVDDLLLLAKLEQPDVLRPEPVEIEPFTLELFAKARALGDREWRLAASEPATVVADPQRLTQAVMNLARNAVDHTGPDAEVSIAAVVAGDTVRLSVADTGPGIPFDDQATIFDRFARGREGRRRSDGAGLGLSIVRAVAEAHGGRVELTSVPGSGARFTIVLPVAVAAIPDDPGDDASGDPAPDASTDTPTDDTPTEAMTVPAHDDDSPTETMPTAEELPWRAS